VSSTIAFQCSLAGGQGMLSNNTCTIIESLSHNTPKSTFGQKRIWVLDEFHSVCHYKIVLAKGKKWPFFEFVILAIKPGFRYQASQKFYSAILPLNAAIVAYIVRSAYGSVIYTGQGRNTCGFCGGPLWIFIDSLCTMNIIIPVSILPPDVWPWTIKLSSELQSIKNLCHNNRTIYPDEWYYSDHILLSSQFHNSNRISLPGIGRQYG